MQNKLRRLIDVNLNRSRESLRVCEDIIRFVLEDARLAKALKDTRHKISKIVGANGRSPLHKLTDIIASRNIFTDIGRKISFDKSRPKNIGMLFYKNIHKAQESIRALEEFSKLAGMELAAHFKTLRFKAYSIEKKAIKRLQALCGD